MCLRMKTLWLVPWLLLGLAGCRPPTMTPVYVDRGVPFLLRAPQTGPAFTATQELVFQEPDGRLNRLITSLENNADHMGLVASAPLGQLLFILDVRQGSVAQDVRVPLPKQFDPRLLPALVQLADWPLEEARHGLQRDAELLEEGNLRTLRRKGSVVLTIRREGSAPPFQKVIFDLPLLHIHAVMTTLEDPS
jgi:hypothetical protein